MKRLHMHHQSVSTNHPFRERTYSRLWRHFYWPKYAKSVESFVKSCNTCQRSKGQSMTGLTSSEASLGRFKHELTHRSPAISQWQQCNSHFCRQVDIVRSLCSNFHFSAWTAAGTAHLYMRNVYRLHGLSQTIVCDRDHWFTAEFFREVFKRLKIDLRGFTSQHPETYGQTERTHRTIGRNLRSVVNLSTE